MGGRARPRRVPLARAARELQDLGSEGALRDRQLIAAISQPADKQDRAKEQGLRERIAAIERRLSDRALCDSGVRWQKRDEQAAEDGDLVHALRAGPPG